MIIIGLTDIHGDTKQLRDISADLSKADVVVVSGDLTHFGRQADAARVVQALQKYNKNILAVPGNCDRPEVSTYLTNEGINLHRNCIVKDKIAFLGVGGSLPCPGMTPNESSETEIESFLDEAAAEIGDTKPQLIFVTHQPPYGGLVDQVGGGHHVGSKSIRNFITKFKSLICLSGHIHEACGVDSIGVTKVVNSGPLHKGGYTYAEIKNGQVTKLEIRGIG